MNIVHAGINKRSVNVVHAGINERPSKIVHTGFNKHPWIVVDVRLNIGGLFFSDRDVDRVGGGLAAPASHTTVRTGPYTAVHDEHLKR